MNLRARFASPCSHPPLPLAVTGFLDSRVGERGKEERLRAVSVCAREKERKEASRSIGGARSVGVEKLAASNVTSLDPFPRS